MGDRSFKNRLEYLAFQLFIMMIRLLPLTWSNWLGRCLGALAYQVLKGRRLLTLENLKAAQANGFLPGTLDLERTARKTWEHLGMLGSEFVYYAHHPQRLMQNMTIDGEADLRRVLDQKRGVIFATAHLGNWEILGARLAMAGFGVNSITKTQSNGLLDEYINQCRRAAGIKSIPKLSFLRPILRAFQQNDIVSFFMDQNAGSVGVPLQVFGRATMIPRGTAEFALKTETPVVFAYSIREAGGRHRIIISEEISIIRTGDYAADVAANTKMFFEMIQTAIGQYPDQWLWMHKLWPTDMKV